MNPLNRRDFLKTGAFAGAGLLLGVGFAGSGIVNAAAPTPPAFEPSVYLRIGGDGVVTLYSKNPEIGQGVKTAMPQIIAEELEVDWSVIKIEQGMLDRRFGPQFAGGSTSIKINFEALRKAGAAARTMLIEAAAKKWKAPVTDCYAELGYIYRRGSEDRFAYGELAADASQLAPPPAPVLKDRRDFKLIGRPLPGADNRAIVTGQPLFGLDSRPRGALVAVIERCPVYGGKLLSYDDTDSLKVNGVKAVIRIVSNNDPTRLREGVAVVAENTWAAIKGRKALKVTWQEPERTESDESLRERFVKNVNAAADAVREDGDVAAALATSEKVLEAVFEVPFLAHVTMEPMNYFADVQPDRVEVRGPTQVPGNVLQFAAGATGLSPEKIKVHMTRSGGGFGRRLMDDYACEAIHLSKELGKPVQVVWTREDDIHHDFFRPAGMYRLTGGLDGDGKLIAWDIKASTTSRYEFAASTNPAYQTEVFPDAFPAGFVPNFRMQYLPVSTEVPRGAWRAPGHNATAWVDQCFLDEMAHLAGKDPVEFRLDLLGVEDRMIPYRDHGGPSYSTRRLREVIRTAAEKGGWNSPAPAGVFRGFACHFMFGAYVAEVVTVSIEGKTPKVTKVVAVVDCGQVINPSGAKNQMEGGIIDGLSAALYQGVHISRGAPVERNLRDYKLLRMKEAPDLEVHLMESDEPPEGLGEMTLPPVAAALCNALFAATGKRVRRLPVTLTVAEL